MFVIVYVAHFNQSGKEEIADICKRHIEAALFMGLEGTILYDGFVHYTSSEKCDVRKTLHIVKKINGLLQHESIYGLLCSVEEHCPKECKYSKQGYYEPAISFKVNRAPDGDYENHRYTDNS